MIARELISQIVAPLRTSDTGEHALTTMHVYHLKHLPIVNSKMLLGTISEEDILVHDLSEPIGSYNLSLNKAHVKANDHLFEVMSKLAENKLTSIPVVDEDENFLGLISQEGLLQFYAKSFSFTEPGSIIVLEMERRDYSLGKLSRLIEAENVSILSSFLTQEEGSDHVYVTLKINKQDPESILATLRRHEFNIRATFSEEQYFENLQERYDALMHYLSV
jgi:predicted transcriptional regulator